MRKCLITCIMLSAIHSSLWAFSKLDSIQFDNIRKQALHLADTGYNEALELISEGRNSNDPDYLVLGYYKLATYYNYKRSRLAIAYYDSAMQQARSEGDHRILSTIYFQMGFYYKNDVYHPDTARLFFQRSLNSALQIQFANGIIRASTGLAYLNMDAGDYGAAMDHLSDIEHLTDSLGYCTENSAVLANMGHMYMKLGLTKNAFNHFGQAYTVAKKDGESNAGHLHYCLMNLAEASILLGKIDDADSILALAGNLRAQNPNIQVIGTFNNQMYGMLYLKKNLYEKAIDYFDSAYDPLHTNVIDQVASLLGQARGHLYLGDTLSSHQLLLKAEALSKDYGRLPIGESLELFRDLASSYGFFEEKERESHFLKKYIDAKETLNRELRVGQFLTRELEKKSQLEKQQASLEKQLLAQQLTNEKQRNYLLITLFILLLGLVTFLIYRSTRRKRYLDELTTLNSQLNATVGELTNVQEQLVQEKKMSAIGSLASGLAHEINNPLNYIQGSLTMLEEIYGELDCEKKDEVFTYLKHSKHGVKQINAVLNNIDAFSMEVPRNLRTIALIPIVNAALELLKYQIPEYVDVTVHPTTDIKSVEGDEVKLIQIFTSVILNSIEAINRKGVSSSSNEFIDVSFCASAGPQHTEHVEIKIANSGEKLRIKDLRKPFDPFYTEKNPGEGMGLGLSAAYFNVKFHKGNITMNNNDQGVETTIILPIHSN